MYDGMHQARSPRLQNGEASFICAIRSAGLVN